MMGYKYARNTNIVYLLMMGYKYPRNTYIVYLLMMGYKYARNMYRLIDEINRGYIVDQVVCNYTDIWSYTVSRTLNLAFLYLFT